MKTKDVFLENLGLRIVQCRKALHLSQEVLAEKTDVSPQTISTAERGEKGLRPENLLKISRALSVSCDYLLTGERSAADFALLTAKIQALEPQYIPLLESVIDHCFSLCENKIPE